MSRSTPSVSILAFKQDFVPDEKIRAMMKSFRQMLNHCIRIGIEQNKTSMKSLSLATYPFLKRYSDIQACYRITANSRAAGILSNYRRLQRRGVRVRIPYCKKPVLVSCYRIKIEGERLIMPQNVSIKLNPYTLRKIRNENVRSVFLTEDSVSISVARESEINQPTGMIGIDLNRRTMTMADSDKKITRLPMQGIIEYRHQCRQRAKRFSRKDLRVGKRIRAKYSKLQADMTISEINKHTARVIRYSAKRQLSISIPENLDDLPKRPLRKLTGKALDSIFRKNSWARGEARRELDYKGLRDGVMVITVNAIGASKECSRCGDKFMFPEENGNLNCPRCNLRISRDANAALNIRKRGLEKFFSTRFKPVGLPSEAMTRGPAEFGLGDEIVLSGWQSSQSKLIREEPYQ